MAGSIGGSQRRVVLDEVAQVAIILLTDGRFQAHRLLTDFDDLAHLLRTDLHLLGNLLGRGFAPQVLQQAAADADQTIDRLYHMDRYTNRASLIRDSTSNSLADPPCGIRAELVALGVVELLDSPDQTDVTFLDQVQQAHTAANILFRYTDNQAQVSLGQTALGLLAIINVTAIRHRLETLSLATLHALCQSNLFLCCEQRDTADLAQVHPHGIVQATLQVSNYNSKAIVQIVPLGTRHGLSIHFILGSRLPIGGWLFRRIQGVHRLFVL